MEDESHSVHLAQWCHKAVCAIYVLLMMANKPETAI